MADYVIERRKQNSDIPSYWAGVRQSHRTWSRDLNDAIIVHSQDRAEDIIRELSQKDRVYFIRELDPAFSLR